MVDQYPFLTYTSSVQTVVETESYYRGEDVPVFLLNVFAKNEKTDLSQACRRAFKNVEI